MACRIPARNDRVPERQARRPGRFDRAIPRLVQAPVPRPEHLRVLPAARRRGRAAPRRATDASPMGGRLHGMVRRTEQRLGIDPVWWTVCQLAVYVLVMAA